MRVVTLNLWGRREPWDGRRAVLRDGLRALDADVLAFQEAVETDGYDQAGDLLCPGFHVVRQRRARTGGGCCAVLASRWPVGTVREVDLQVTAAAAGSSCTALVAEILAPPPLGSVLFVDDKPSWQPELELERRLQAVAVARCVDGLAPRGGLPVVVAGDFDATPEADSVRFWTSGSYADAWEHAHPGDPGHTFTPRNPLVSPDEPGRRIDYVLVRRDEDGRPTLDIAACTLAFDRPVNGVWASDHFAVVADLRAP